MNHRADRLSLVHEVKRRIDVPQLESVSDEGIEFDLPSEVALHVARQLGSALYPAKRRPAPDASGYELEGACADLFARPGDADDDRLSPTLMTTLQRGAHHFDVADAFKGKVHPSCHFDNDFLYGPVVICGVDHISRSQLARNFKFSRVQVDRNDAPGLGLDRADDYRQTD